MSMNAGKEINNRMHVSGYLAVKCGKAFKQEEEHIQDHSIGDNAGQRANLLITWIKLRVSSNDETEEDEHGRPGSKCG